MPTPTEEINVALRPDTDIAERAASAVIDHTVQQNWMAEKLAVHLQLKVSSDSAGLCEDWKGRAMQSTGTVICNWSRRDVDIPKSFNDIMFHIVSGRSFEVLIGNELLLAEPDILNPKRGVQPVVPVPKGNKEQEAEREKQRQEGQALMQASQAYKAGGQQQGSQAGGQTTGQANVQGATGGTSTGK